MIFVYFHGAFGYPTENWSPYLRDNLYELGHTYLAPEFPCDDFDEVTDGGPETPNKHQRLDNWIQSFDKFYENELGKVTDKLCFIGHSLAPLFILHVLSNYPIFLDCAIFVSPFLRSLKNEKYWQFDHVNKTFYKTDFKFDELRDLIDISYVLYGDDDPYVPRELFLEFVEKVGGSKIEIRGGRHLGSNFEDAFPLLLELCKSRIC